MHLSCGSKIAAGFNYLKEFCNETTLHGLNHVVAPKRHWLERMLWILALIAAIIGSTFIMLNSWNRYATSPIVISIVKGSRGWNITLPAITMCFHEKFNQTRGRNFTERKWAVTSGEKYDYYMKFLHALSNAGLETLSSLEEFSEDEELNQLDFLQTIYEVNFNFIGPGLGRPLMTVSNKESRKVGNHTHNMLEMGDCYTVHPRMSRVLWNHFFPTRSVKQGRVFNCVGETNYCSATAQNFPDANAYLHAIDEIPDVYSKFNSLAEVDYRVRVQEESLLSSDDVRDLWAQQRKCFFSDETIYGDLPAYSFNLCKMQCRRDIFYQRCGCAPHFYIQIKGQKVCDLKGLACVSKIAEEVINMTSPKNKSTCKCYPSCEETMYFPLSDSEETAKNLYILILGDFGRTRYRRDIIFEFSDLLVNFGGTAALFLGCSLMTGIELLYFFTLRLLRLVGRKAVIGGKFLRKALADQLERRTSMLTSRR